jgi:hypothetical protein
MLKSGVLDICVAFFEVPSIHDIKQSPIRNVRYPGLGMGQRHAGNKEVAFIDCRKEGSDYKEVCSGCSLYFRRVVALY